MRLFAYAINSKKDVISASQPGQDFFSGLLDRLAFLKVCEKHNFVDYIIYAFYKTSLYVAFYAQNEKFSRQELKSLVKKYNFSKNLAFCLYFKNQADFPNQTDFPHDLICDIAENRTRTYDSIFYADPPYPYPWPASNVSNALYSFIKNGWKKSADGHFSDVPNFDFKCELEMHDKEFSKIHAKIDTELLEYCDSEMKKFIDCLKSLK